MPTAAQVLTIVNRPDRTVEVYRGRHSYACAYAGTLQNAAEREGMIAESIANGTVILITADRNRQGFTLTEAA